MLGFKRIFFIYILRESQHQMLKFAIDSNGFNRFSAKIFISTGEIKLSSNVCFVEIIMIRMYFTCNDSVKNRLFSSICHFMSLHLSCLLELIAKFFHCSTGKFIFEWMNTNSFDLVKFILKLEMIRNKRLWIWMWLIYFYMKLVISKCRRMLYWSYWHL